ncbi:MAG: polysaccharide biosynthesis tyrosine autokinase [Chitinophagaceae bacterium]|nr:polysaccharide biosynthesis tyrosine autokinase [Chitinophagaceae bacterium]
MPEQSNNQEQSNNKSELWNLSVKDLFYKYVRFLPLFLLSVAVALLIAFAYLRYTSRVYAASGTMLIESEQQSSSSDKVEDILTGTRSQNIQTEIEMLKSRPLMARVVNKLGLQFNYLAKGKVKDFNIYKQGPFVVQLFEIADSNRAFSMNVKFIDNNRFRIDNESNTFTFGQLFRNMHGVFRLVKQSPAGAGNEYNISWEPTMSIAGALAAAVKVQPKTPGTGILTVSIQSTNAQLAADIVNSLMIEYDSMTVEQNNYSTDQMLGFINERLTILNHELDSLQMKFLRYKQENNLIDVEKQLGDYFTRITDVDKSIVETQFKLDQAEEINNYLGNKRNHFNKVTPSALTLQDVTLNELVSNYNRAQLTRQSLLDANVPEENPAVKEAEGQIEKLRENLLENLRNIRLSYSAVINQSRARSGAEQSRLQSLPFKLKEYVEMERQINTKLALYNLLEGKREEASIGRASTISNSKVIDLASASNVPVKPNKRTIQLLAILAGIGLPALIIFIGEILNDKISTRFDIEKITKAPILGEIGHSFSDNTLIVNKTSRTMVAEQFRIIRSNLQYVISNPQKSVILVTSSFSGEGKSFISTNMAAVLALTGKRTVILEFDIRKPKVLTGLNMTRRPGITNFMLGKAPLEELVAQVPDQENLYVLACGPIPPNPSEMLLDSKITDLFNWMRDNFDVIVVDTAPVGMVSDAMTLSKFADCTLYLVRQGHTFKKQVALIDELYTEGKLPKVSVIINDVKVKPGYGYYGYGRYGYGYGYGYGAASSYYEEEKAPLTFAERFLGKFKLPRWIRRRR